MQKCDIVPVSELIHTVILGGGAAEGKGHEAL